VRIYLGELDMSERLIKTLSLIVVLAGITLIMLNAENWWPALGVGLIVGGTTWRFDHAED